MYKVELHGKKATWSQEMLAMYTVELQGTKATWRQEVLEAKLWNVAALTKESTLCIDWKLRTPSIEGQKVILNQLNSQVLASRDKRLIWLFRRAVCNHDALNKTEQANPVVIHNKYHRKSDFRIPTTHITLDVKEDAVYVTSQLTVLNKRPSKHLILDGVGHDVIEVSIGDERLSADKYIVTPHELIILALPNELAFNIEIKSKINPYDNTSGQGMYRSGKEWLTTHCEAEGARKIFYTIDRPEIRSLYVVAIIADPKKYPTCMANGNLALRNTCEDGRTMVVYQDPFPKPSYLFAAVLGNFGLLQDTFTTRTGRVVKLQIYVEKGKEKRVEYAMWALKKAMKFDEEHYDREYDLDQYVIVGVPDFNAGAMENKGLNIFNDTALLVDSQSGSDSDFKNVAHTVAHEYDHNWSGNRVTVKTWFELALKEAFTDFRAIEFVRKMFTEEASRVEEVKTLREIQFPEDAAKTAHPIVVDSFVTSQTIYDATTYVKGREIFGMLKTILDAQELGLFRKVLNEYFKRYDGKAVTYQHLLKTAVQVSESNLLIFSRWFSQAGTPTVTVSMLYDPFIQTARVKLTQSCLSPKDGSEQEPFHIPIFLEFISREGQILMPKTLINFKKSESTFVFDEILTKPIVVFLHGFSAPVKYQCEYSDEDLVTILYYCSDPFWKWEAGQIFAKRQIKGVIEKLIKDPKCDPELPHAVADTYAQALMSEKLSPLVKGQLLDMPSIRALTEGLEEYDFPLIGKAITLFKKKLAEKLEGILNLLIDKYPSPKPYDPMSPDFAVGMQIRELRFNCIRLLVGLNPEKYAELILKMYQGSDNFHERKNALVLITDMNHPAKEMVLKDFYEKWKSDSVVFLDWLSVQAMASTCTVDTLEGIIKEYSGKGYDPKTSNHYCSLYRPFLRNLERYHDVEGRGYAYITDKIIEVSRFNPDMAIGYLADKAYADYAKLPPHQKALMREQLLRIQRDLSLDSTLRDIVSKHLS